MALKGRCLCEKVRYTVEGEARDVINCHCSRCRRSTGHFMAATRAAVDEVTITGDSLKWYQPVDGTYYGFCGDCGSTLFWRADRTKESISIAAGTLTPPTGLKTTKAIYLDYGSDYHHYDELLDSYPESH